jgi:hypothetical protein
MILSTQNIPLECAEWQRRICNMQTWPIFKAFSTEAHRENRMISQTALRSGYHTANMAAEIPSGPFEAYDVARHYHQTPVTSKATT